MDFEKWETVVVEWINCLKLSKALHSIKDLRDGSFLTNLVKVLKRDESCITETFLSVLLFLKEQYPNVVFKYLDDCLIQDTPETDLLIISSLLLHYSCIFDRRDFLTAPLCQKLPQTTQVLIRSFLENTKNHISKEELFQIIDQCIKKDVKPKVVQTYGLQAADSVLLCRSPLQDLLQATPPSKSARLQEKDKEITKLRYDIEMECFEKTDLQHELEVQKERNKKLTRQMSDKTTEIIKLRTEIAELENNISRDQDVESCELQRRLRGEIDSLEKYIAQLQEEQDTLYNERDSIKERLKKVETQYMIWHDKALSNEQNYENLLEKHQEQDLEVQQLRSQCMELKDLLQELQTGNQSVELDIGSRTLETGASCEDLACAVVEVQLRDAQKENVELNDLLKESQENVEKLRDELLNVTNSFGELQTNYQSLSRDNNDLHEKVSILTTTETHLQNTRKELEQTSQELIECMKNKEVLSSSICNLEKQLEESCLKLTTMESTNKILANDLAIHQNNYTKLETLFIQKNKTCNAFEEQVNVIQTEYDTLLDKYKNQDLKLQSVTKNFNEVTSNMEQNLQKIEKFIFGNNSIDMNDMNLAFEKIFNQLQQNSITQENEKEMLSKHLCEFEELVVKLKADLACLNEKQTINLEERQTLSQNLKCAEDQVDILENTITEYVNKVQNLNDTIFEMTTTIADLEVLKDVVVRKENVIIDLKASCANLEINLAESNDELTENKAIQEDLYKSLENLEKIKHDFENQILEMQKELGEHKENETKLIKTIAELHALTSIFEQRKLETTEELTKYKQNEEKLQQTLEHLEDLKTTLEHQLNDANDKISQQEIYKNNIQEEYYKKCQEYDKLTHERNQDVSRGINLQEQLYDISSKLAVAEAACTDKDDLISNANQDLLKLKLDVEQKSEILKNLEAGVQERDSKIEELAEQICALDTRNKELNNQTTELQKECLILEKLKGELEIKCMHLETNAWNIVSELSSKNIQLDDLIKKCKHQQLKTQGEIEELTNALDKSQSELQEATDVKNSLVVENKKQIDDLQDKILEFNHIIESLNNQQIQYLEEISRTRDELTDTVMKYTESLQVCQEMQVENETQVNNLTENLHEVIERYNNLDKTHTETLAELENIQEHLQILENVKLQLETELIQQKSKYDEDYEKNSTSLNNKIFDLLQRESVLKVKVLELTDTLKLSEENNDDLNEDFNKAHRELSQLKNEKAVLYQNLSQFNDSYQELKDLHSGLKLALTKLIDENNQNLKMFQNELSQQIGSLVEENVNLKEKIKEHEENLNIIQNQHEEIKTMQTNKLQQKEETIKTLEADNQSCIADINNLIEKNRVLQEQITIEAEQLYNCQKTFEQTNQNDQSKILEHAGNIIKLKSANEILETGNAKLQEEIDTINSKIQELEKCKLVDTRRFSEAIQCREEQIISLQEQISENVCKNSELLLELSTVSESLSSLSKQHLSLQQISAEEIESYSEKLHQAETESTNKERILEDLKLENQSLAHKIIIVQREMENLTDKLQSHLIERQTLDLEIKTTSEKLLRQDSIIRGHEATISEANAKVFAKLEEILKLEKENRILQEKLEEFSKELNKVKRSRDDILESQAKIIKETENNMIRAHENAIEVKNDLLKRIELVENEKINEKQLRIDLEKVLEEEKVAKEVLETRVLELNNEKCKFSQLFFTLNHSIQSLYNSLNEKQIEIVMGGASKESEMEDMECLNTNIEMIKARIMDIMEQSSLCTKQVSILEKEKLEIINKIEELTNEKQVINQEKENLSKDYNILYNELTCFKETQLAHDLLKAKYEQLVEYNTKMKNENIRNQELQETLGHLEKKSVETYNILQKYAGYSSTYKTAIEKLITERNVLDTFLNNLQQNLSTIQMKMLQVSDDREHTRLMEQVRSFEIILEDIQKQSTRISKKIHDIILTIITVPVDVFDVVASTNSSKADDIFDKFDFEEELEKVVDCRDRAADLLQQIAAFDGTLTMKLTKVQKENVLRSSNNTNTEVKIKDEELKKRNTMLKQRLTLAENSKSNLEKKIKQLRQENKILNSRSENPLPAVDHDARYKALLCQHIQAKEEYEKTLNEQKAQYDKLHQEIKQINSRSENPLLAVDHDSSYKALLRQHIQAKEEYEKTLNELEAQYAKLHQEHEEYKIKHKFIPEQIKYEKYVKTEQDVKTEGELIKLREAYGNLMSDNSKYELENATMRKLLDDRTSQLSEVKLIKESYEKLLEENNKLRMEVDTIKYKRNRDREALMEAVKKSQNDNKKVQEVRTEYEAKLEKMKEKMVQLYREEIDREAQKQQKDQNEKTLLLKNIDQLKQSLRELQLENRRNIECRNCEFCTSRLSTSSYHTLQDSLPFRSLVDDRNSISRRKPTDDRKYATLPKSTGMTIIEEDTALKRNTLCSVPRGLGQNLEMEDEDDDLFNNKYLVDLKEGRCMLPPNEHESNTNRLSQLKWRNSLCPPHLKSSYPAETQFSSPGQFKEEELKLGIADFDDSMSTRLIPGEKPRKKDFGTTSYKKPGPPTPSKNGGRLSLQGNEPHPRDVLREQNEKTPKRTTPSRLKALFMGRSVRDNSENQPGTPRSKRLSIFRKQK